MIVPAYIQLDHGAVFSDERQAIQPQIALDLQHFRRGFAAAKNNRDLVVL